MVITTRSKDQQKKENDVEPSTMTKKKKKHCVILKIENPKRNKEETSSSDEDNSSEDEFEEEFIIPDYIKKNKNHLQKSQNIINYINKHTIQLQDILDSTIRMKHKAELFEYYFIYENTDLNSEERMELRKTLYNMYKDYVHEYNQYIENKDQIKYYEKQERKKSSELDLQYEILRLQTTDTNKEVIFYKYMELKEKTEHDDEYYKLKKWIKYALELPFDRIKAYPHLQDNGVALTELLNNMKKTMDNELFGMKGVKEQILLFLHNKLMFPEMKGCCMGLVGPAGVGKCLARGTKVWLPSGNKCKVENLVVGDFIMGDDSTPRQILSIAHGKEIMVRVHQSYSSSYIVNKSHILSLVDIRTMQIVDIPIKDLLQYPENVQYYRGYQQSTTFIYNDSNILCTSLLHRLQYVQQLFMTYSIPDNEPFHFYLYSNDKDYRDLIIDIMRSIGLMIKEQENSNDLLIYHWKHVFNSIVDNSYVMTMTPIMLEELDEDIYYGFTIDGNHRFILENFAITHNTSIARCIAKILDFPFQQISFGGIHNSEFLKGFDYTYVGSQPGEISKVLMRMKYKNGIMFFDEYEKISQNNEIVSFLLHLTDFSQNYEYRDNYLNDLIIDLSSMWFIYSMNELPEDKALQDRIFTVQVDGYTIKEKIRIMCDFLFPRHLKTQNRNPSDIVVSDETAMYIIEYVSDENEKGIRSIERGVKDLIHKIHFLVTHHNSVDVSFLYKKCQLSYPVVLTTDMVNVLLKDMKKDLSYRRLYL